MRFRRAPFDFPGPARFPRWRWPEPPDFPGPPGPRFGRRSERLFERGDLKYVILELLAERPRHGYDVIRALEDRFRGLYSPSPGSVYPVLQLLEDQGLVRGQEQDGRRVYAVTDEGRAFLHERAERTQQIRARAEARWQPELRSEMALLMQELAGLGRSLFGHRHRLGRRLDPARVRRIRDVVVRAGQEIETILAEDAPPPPDQPPPTTYS